MPLTSAAPLLAPPSMMSRRRRPPPRAARRPSSRPMPRPRKRLPRPCSTSRSCCPSPAQASGAASASDDWRPTTRAAPAAGSAWPRPSAGRPDRPPSSSHRRAVRRLRNRPCCYGRSAQEQLEPQGLHAFVQLILENDLAELGIRTLRRHLVEHPDDEVAKEQLRRVAESYQGRALQAAVHIRRQGPRARSPRSGSEILRHRRHGDFSSGHFCSVPLPTGAGRLLKRLERGACPGAPIVG